ncbi:MAG: hypothetical protein GX802_08390 [Clostridiales bacterium]|nr:hypothetical protein [Clostridiales bacterium]
MKALHYIALSPDETVLTDEVNRNLWHKANESRLNQNFSSLLKHLEVLEDTLSQIQDILNRE